MGVVETGAAYIKTTGERVERRWTCLDYGKVGGKNVVGGK